MKKVKSCCEDLEILSFIFTGDKILILCIKHLRERKMLFNFIEVYSEKMKSPQTRSFMKCLERLCPKL